MISSALYKLLLSTRYRDYNEAVKHTRGYAICSFKVANTDLRSNQFYIVKNIKLVTVAFNRGSDNEILEYLWIEDS